LSDSTTGHVVLINGGSSAGKSTIGRKLQSSLTETWILTSVDVVIWTMPHELEFNPEGFMIENGFFLRGEEFMRLFAAFQASVVAQAKCGVNVLVEDVFLDGVLDQHRWRAALGDVETLWVGVHCSPDIAAAREIERGDRPIGIARNEANAVHEGVHYALEVDTGTTNLADVVDTVASGITNRWALASTPASNDAPAIPPRQALSIDGTIDRAPWEH